jgi:hypothetical protein
MDDATMVQQLTGCTREEAEKALNTHETVLDAVESLIPANPVVSGAKYIPPKPKVDTGMDPEQQALCERGRWLQDKVNAVFSVAHSKIQPSQSAEQSLLQSVEESVATIPVALIEESESSQGSREQTVQPFQPLEKLQ